MKQVERFCKCVKAVRKTIKLRPGSGRGMAAKEKAAIGVCVKSVLQRKKGRTLKKFNCRKGILVTQATQKER